MHDVLPAASDHPHATGTASDTPVYGNAAAPAGAECIHTVDPCGCVGIGCDVCGISIPEAAECDSLPDLAISERMESFMVLCI